ICPLSANSREGRTTRAASLLSPPMRLPLLLVAAASVVHAEPVAKEALPDALKPWTQWVLHGQEEKLCPFIHGSESRICAWPGRLALTLRGKPVASPNREEGGELYLQKEAAPSAEAEHFEIKVHRKVTDEIPLLLTTRIELNVAGKSREVLLGKALPAGFVPM